MSKQPEQDGVVVIDVGLASNDIDRLQEGRPIEVFDASFISKNGGDVHGTLVIGDKAIPMSKVRGFFPYMRHMDYCSLFDRGRVNIVHGEPAARLCSCGLDKLKEELRTMGVDL